MKARIIATVANTVLFGALCISYRASAQQVRITPRQLPQIPMTPAIQQSMPGPYPAPLPMLIPIQTPALPFGNGPIIPPSPVQMGLICYAGQVVGSLAQFAPVGTQCSVLAYGVEYTGVVGQ